MPKGKTGIKEKGVDLDLHLFHQVLADVAKILVEKVIPALAQDLFHNHLLISPRLLKNYLEEYYIFL